MAGSVFDHLDTLAGLRVARPIGVVCDVDGTLSPIAPTPDDAVIPVTVGQALRRLAAAVEVIATLSGRSATDVCRLLDRSGLADGPVADVTGNHGLEIWTAGRLVRPPAVEAYLPIIAEVVAAGRRELTGPGGLPGVLVEDKGATISIHYRLAPDPNEAGPMIRDWSADQARRHGLRITEGRQVIEIRPPVKLDKGSALRRVIARHNLATALYLGDDRTDVDAFRALQDWRQTGGQGWAIGVVNEEAPPEVAASADYTVVGVDEVAELLNELAVRWGRSGEGRGH